MKEIDLLELNSEFEILNDILLKLIILLYSTDIEMLVTQIVQDEPLISDSKKPHLRRMILSFVLIKQFF